MEGESERMRSKNQQLNKESFGSCTRFCFRNWVNSIAQFVYATGSVYVLLLLTKKKHLNNNARYFYLLLMADFWS